MKALSLPLRYGLDNAAQIFVNIMSPGETTLSRIGLIMEETVDRDRFQQAMNRVIPKRFPYFQVYLKKSAFAYVLERTDDLPALEDDSFYTNRYVDFHQKRFLFRFRTDGTNIALEMSHIISDGYGTLTLLLSVTAEYLRLGGVEVEDSPFIFHPESQIDPAEWGCGYAQMFDPKGPPFPVDRPAYIPSGRPIPFDRYYITRIQMNLDKVRALAREHHVTMVVLMSGFYLWVIQEMYLEDLAAGTAKPGKPLRMQIPVNLRKDYPTRSLKNFVYIYSPEYSLSSAEDGLSLDEIIQLISERIRQERHHHIVENQIRRNLRTTNLFVLKYMPRGLKEIVLSIFYQMFARGLFSGVLTSIGEITLPPALEKRVKALDIVACNSPAPGRNSSMFSYRGILEINIGSTVEDQRLEDKLLKKLRLSGLETTVLRKREPA